MKLVIMIPCLNEADTLPLVFKTIPKKISGIDAIEVLIINDGSTDDTVAVAKRLGAQHFINHARNQGLAYSFRDGLQGALDLGADIIVLTDGDNQYPQERIPDLIRPIMEGHADTVIADRQIATIEHFSPMKKWLQRVGTKVLNFAAGTNIPDATSGFRAYSRKAAAQLNLVPRYSFGMETLIQAGQKRQAIGVITIETNPKTRDSRLMKSSWMHVRHQSIAIIRSFIMYRPYAFFFSIGGVLLVLGLIPFINFAYIALTRRPNVAYGPHHLQSLIIGTVLLTGAFISFMLGVIADLIRINRSMTEDMLECLRRTEYVKDSHHTNLN